MLCYVVLCRDNHIKILFLRVPTWLPGRTTISKVRDARRGREGRRSKFPNAGTGCEMYTETLSHSFSGMTFAQAAE